jgi:hypothetical protein
MKSFGLLLLSYEKSIYILISILYVCVWSAIDSLTGGHTDMRPLSLEPVGS